MLPMQANWPDRLRCALAVAALHLLLGYALVAGFALAPAPASTSPLKLFDVAAPPQEPPAPAPARAAPEREAAAAPPDRAARPSPVVAPPPMVAIEPPPPLVAAPVAGAGPDPSAGAAALPGPGTGAGGEGTGLGSGRGGDGAGGDGRGRRPRLLRGRIVEADYPRAAWRQRAGGTVVARLSIGADGAVAGCAIHRSSGHAALDAATCRLIRERFRYAPARDAAGRAVPSETGWRQRWWLERHRAR